MNHNIDKSFENLLKGVIEDMETRNKTSDKISFFIMSKNTGKAYCVETNVSEFAFLYICD